MAKKKSSSKSFLIFILMIIVLALGFLYQKRTEGDINNLKIKVIPEIVKKLVNNPSTPVTIGDLKETNGLYEFELTLGKDASAQKYTSYISKDGKLFFTSGVKTADLKNPPQNQAAKTPAKLTCTTLDKSEKPNLTAFIVSNCPFGLQMQRVFSKALGELSDLSANLDIRYMGSIENGKIISMHGDKEAQENLKQICIREEQQAKYWDYVSCYMQEGKSEDCSTSAGIDTQKLNSCTTDSNRGLKYAKADFDLSAKFGVSSSPTLILNNKQTVSEFDFGGRIPNAIKEIVGCSYKTKPDVFKKDLSKDEVATAFSQTGAGSSGNSGSGSNAAQCAPAK